MRPQTRYEVKYRIPPLQAEELRSWLPRYAEADANGEGGRPEYDVHSLYLDSRDWSVYRDTRNGAFARFKLRARTYSFAPDADAFLEVKARSGEAMGKTRHRCSRADAIAVLSGELPSAPSTPALENFRHLVDQRRAFPRVWITYRRAAFVAEGRQLVRVTFDDRIRAAPPTEHLREPPVWQALPEVRGLVVLELKYSGSYPGWAAEMIRRFGLERRSMSKYRHGVDLLRSASPVAWSSVERVA